jgi:glucosylceramidase
MKDTVRAYISTLDGKQEIAQQSERKLRETATSPCENTIVIDPTIKFQPIFGFGGTLMDTDVYCLTRMSSSKQDEVLQALFDKKEGAGWNFMRVPLGSSDWERNTDFYTYDDMPRGQKDWNLENFSIQRDIDRGLPTLIKKIKAINPEVAFMTSVWGVPGWMKENDNILFGRFNPDCTDIYARYLRKALQAWKELGIEFYAITTQNETLTSDDRATPACRFTWRMQAAVLKSLKREFEKHGIKTQIWCYDHNFDMAAAFVEPMLNDNEMSQVIDGVALHDYGGSPKVMGKLQAMFPDMPFYMTERYVGAPSELDRIIQQFHNGSRSYIQWTTMTDEYGGPHQFLGRPFIYNKPKPPENRNFVYNYLNSPDTWGKGSSWALYGQFTKFVRRGMIRISSSYGHEKWITCVAFQHPDGEIAIVAINQTELEQAFVLRIGNSEYVTTLAPQAVATYLVVPGELCGKTRIQVSAAPEKAFPEVPMFDLEVTDIMFASSLKAGEEATLVACVSNVGDEPTPSGCPLYVNFLLDGDCAIGRSVTIPQIINPGCDIVVTANIPFGMKDTWTVEAGYHFISAYVELGNSFQECNTDNNRLIKEFFFEER